MSISIGDAVLKMGVDKTEFDSAMKNMDTNIQSSMEKFKTGLRVGGAAMTAFGAAGLVMIQSTKKMNTELAMAGVNLGMTGKEMRNLALEITNVTFPLESVVATFDLLSRAGIKTAEDMRTVANDFDMLADAIGSTAEVVGETMIMGMKTFRLELTDSGKYLDNMTYLLKNTTLSLEDLNSCLGYTTAEAVDMGLTFDDTIAILGVLESKGVSGAVATRAWRSALSESEKTGLAMNVVLGVTNEEMAEFNQRIAEAEGITAKYAKMSAEQFTIMDKVKQKWSELTLSASGFLEPLEPILAGMTAMGPMMILLSTSMGTAALKTGLHTIALIAHGVAMVATKIAIWAVTAAQWAWNVAMTANPIGLIILAIMALIAIIILIVKNWDTVREKTVEIWNNIIGFLRGVWENIVGFFRDNWALILAILFPAIGLPILIAQHWGEIIEVVKNIWNNVIEWFKGIPERIGAIFATVKDWILAPFRAAMSGIEAGINWIIRQMNKIKFTIPKWVPGIGGQTWGIKIPEISLPKFHQGGLITEPTLLYGLRTQRPYAVAEKGEMVTPAGAAGGVTINVSQLIVREEADVQRIARELLRLAQLRTAYG